MVIIMVMVIATTITIVIVMVIVGEYLWVRWKINFRKFVLIRLDFDTNFRGYRDYFIVKFTKAKGVVVE